MINICTLSDKNYFRYGLAMYDSLLEQCKQDFTLYYLCLDDETYDKLKEMDLKNVEPIPLQPLKETKGFKMLEENTVYNPSGDNTYCWALASFFTEYLVAHLNLNDVLYVDADICFYGSVDKIHDFVSQKSIGIMLHRHNEIGTHVGAYNVGLVYFKNDEIGYNCLRWWRDSVINTRNEWADQYGTCGDQKYLEAFALLFGKENICVIDEEIGHGAPWNMSLYEYLDEELGGQIKWSPEPNMNIGIEAKTRIQPMSFVHFSQFTPDYENSNYRVDRAGAWVSFRLQSRPEIIRYYNDWYVRTMKYKDIV